MAIDAERIALIVELATRDAKESLGRELAAYDAQLALNRAFGNNRRWLGLSDRLVKAGRSFIDELAMRIRAIDAGSDAMAIYSKAVESFAGHLDHIFHDHWAKDAPWRRNKDAPPPTVWQSEKNQLELALKVQQAEFGSEPASAGQRAKGPQWKRFDEAVNLVAWLLTSPKAPTDYGSAGATNLARFDARQASRGLRRWKIMDIAFSRTANANELKNSIVAKSTQLITPR